MFVPLEWPDPYQALAAAYTATGDADLAEWANAMVAGQTGDVDGAIKRLEAIADGDAALDARIGLGLLAESQGDDVTATTWYRKALELDADNTSAQLGLSRVSDGTQAHPAVGPSTSPEGSN
jgi:predicted negative regulator of RcsB-dependent stress response